MPLPTTPSSPLYTDTAFAVAVEPEVPCVTMTWRGYHTSAQFRAHNDEVMALIVRTGASKLLGDIRDFTLIGADDQRWLNDVWLPSAMDQGLRYAALVVPVFYFNKVAVQTVVDRIAGPVLRVQYVDSRDAGRAWLKAQPPTT
jgi:hypothetical protein